MKKKLLILATTIFLNTTTKPLTKETVEKMHKITSILTIAHAVAPEFVEKIKRNKYYNDLNFNAKININKVKFITSEMKEYIHKKIQSSITEDINTKFYLPTIINEIIASSLDKNIDMTSEIIDNIKKLNTFAKNIKIMNPNTPGNNKEGFIAFEFVILLYKILTKTTNKYLLNNLLKNYDKTKRFFNIIILSAIEICAELINEKFNLKNTNQTIVKVSLEKLNQRIASVIIKNIAVETLGGVLKSFIQTENEKSKFKHLMEIKVLINQELRLKNIPNETKPVTISSEN